MLTQKSNVTQQQLKALHHQYTVGNTAQDALDYCAMLNTKGIRCIISNIGEKSCSEEQAISKATCYCNLLQNLEGKNGTVSVKPSDIGIMLNFNLAVENLERILICAQETGKTVEIDMEFRSMLNVIVKLCRHMIDRRFSLRIAQQSALLNAIELAEMFIERADANFIDLSFRIVTGSCYAKNGNGYITTLETPIEVTNSQFYSLVDMSAQWAEQGHHCSAVGTGVSERIDYAAQQGLELQFLKGEEQSAGYIQGLKLHSQGVGFAVYTAFGDLTNSGVQSYLLRR